MRGCIKHDIMNGKFQEKPCGMLVLQKSVGYTIYGMGIYHIKYFRHNCVYFTWSKQPLWG